jgi:hypothetical protein
MKLRVIERGDGWFEVQQKGLLGWHYVDHFSIEKHALEKMGDIIRRAQTEKDRQRTVRVVAEMGENE